MNKLAGLFVVLLIFSSSYSAYAIDDASCFWGFVKRGDIENAGKILEKHPEILNRKDRYGGTFLHQAVINCNWKAVKLLLEMGAHTNTGDCLGYTPLHLAAAIYGTGEAYTDDHFKIVKALVENGANPNVKNKEGLTPLEIALRKSDRRTADCIYHAGAQLYNTHTAAAMGNYEKIREFIQKKPKSVDEKDNFSGLHATPLMWAVWGDDIEVASLLIAKGADVNARDSMKRTPLHWAANGGSYKVTRLLIKKGAKVNSLDQYDYTPLYWTQIGGKPSKNTAKVAEILWENGGRTYVDPPPKPYDMIVDLFDSVRENDIKRFKKLLARKPELVNARDESTITILQRAVGYDRKDMVSHLISKGAFVNTRDNQQRTPLHWVKSKEIARLLIESGASVNARDIIGDTPLHMAIADRRKELADYLRSKGGIDLPKTYYKTK